VGLGFASVLALLVAICIAAFWTINSVSESFTAYQGAVESSGEMWEQQDDVSQIRINVLSNLSSNEDSYIAAALALAEELEGDMARHLADATTQAQKDTFLEMADDVTQFSDSFVLINKLWAERTAIITPMVDQGAQMVALIDEVLVDFTNARSVPLLALTAQAQRELLFGRLYMVKFLEDPSKQNYQTAVNALNDNNLGALIDKLKGMTQSAEIKDDFDKFEALRNTYVNGLHNLYRVLSERTQVVHHTINELGPELSDDLEKLKAVDIQHQIELGQHTAAVNQLGVLLVSIFSAIAITLGITIAYFLPRSIRKPIGGEPRDIQALANQIAEGDLTAEFTHNGTESGIYASMREMTAKLTSIVDDVTDASGNVSSAAEQIAAGSQELSQRTEEQASSLEETAASIEELTATVKTNADNAMQANQLAEGARDKAVAGGIVVKSAQQAMDEMSSASNQIKEIIEVIEGISFQTNLLSLNASVEAARAGEQGRGFAVVAAEVGKLASKSSDAAKDIKGLINSTVSKVESGAALVAQSGTALQAIIASVTKVTDIVAEISAASQEQAAGISQVNKAITQMDEVTQHNASQVEETAAAADALNEQARHLRELVRFFTTTNSGLKQAVVRSNASTQRAASTPRPAKARAAAKPAAKSVNEDGWDKF
tara:strand:+ start:1916 stop:3898 length:1983 start_codon:yes stop_codon:yes gene_type:complete